MAKTEVEVRAVLNHAQRAHILEFMGNKSKINRIKRVMIDFSGDDRTKTIVLRLNNGLPELVAKSGKLTDTVRLEASVNLTADDFINALSILNILGYKEAMVSIRDMHVAEIEGMEYSVRDIVSLNSNQIESTLFDLEYLNCPAGKEQAAIKELINVLDSHNLKALDDKSWSKWVKDIYNNVDFKFKYSKENIETLFSDLKNAKLI